MFQGISDSLGTRSVKYFEKIFINFNKFYFIFFLKTKKKFIKIIFLGFFIKIILIKNY